MLRCVTIMPETPKTPNSKIQSTTPDAPVKVKGLAPVKDGPPPSIRKCPVFV